MKGILHKSSEEIRSLIEEFVYFLAVNIRPNNLSISELPLEQFLASYLDTNLLLNYNTNCDTLYELLTILVNHHKHFGSTEKLLDLNKKLRELMDHLRIFATSEDSNIEITDAALSGIMKLANELINMKGNTESLNISERIKNINQIFMGCLFPGKNERFICKTTESRQAAYKLIGSLAQRNTECWSYLLRNCVFPLREKINELDVWMYSPGVYEHSRFGYTGLKNLGCICYINSMLQQFFMIPPFRNSITSICDGKAPNIGENGIDDNLLHQLQRLFVYLMKSKRKYYNPVAFCYSFKEADGKPTNTAVQHDAQEFLNILFERLERIVQDTPYKYITQSIFGAKLCSQVICTNCGYISSTYEDYYTLSLEIKNQLTLEDSLGKFIVGSTVSEYQCRNCRNKVDAIKRTLISTLPNVLIIYLQRFTFNFDTLTNEKIHTRLSFPKILDMTNYTEEGSGNKEDNPEHNEGKLMKEANHPKEDLKGVMTVKEESSSAKPERILKEKDYYTYKLVGVVVHNGNAESGHYYSYINTNRGQCENTEDYLKPEQDTWLEFNDSNISQFSFSRLEEECFGGTSEEIRTGYIEDGGDIDRILGGRSKSAYMLVYERKSKGMIPLKMEEKEIAKESIVLNNLECDSATISRAEKQQLPLYGKDSNNDLYAFYNFHNVPCTISHELIKEVERDNENYLYERLIYDNDFISFLCGAFSIPGKIYNQELYSDLYYIVDYFFFDILSHTNLPNSLAASIDDMVAIFSASPENSKKLLERFIANPQRIFNLLIRCSEQVMRTLTQRAIVTAATSLSIIENEVLMELIDALMSLIGYELSVQWIKFGHFFEVLNDVVFYSNRRVLHYCLSKDILTPLLDFFLEDASPVAAPNTKRYEMGNPAQAPDFTPLVGLISYLVINSELPDEPKEINRPEDLKVLRTRLSESAEKCLKSDAFIPRYMKWNGKIDCISNLLSYFCKENKKFSKKMCIAALKEINNCTITNHIQSFELIFKLLAIRDQWEAMRAEWILGYAHPIQNYNYGLNVISDIKSDVNAYASPLLYNRHEKPLLQLMWNYKKHYEELVLFSLKQLLSLANTNEVIYIHLRDMPPPSYLYSRYTDWVPEFLEDCTKLNLLTKDDKLKRKEIMISETAREYELFCNKVTEDNVRPPQYYMIGKVLETRRIEDKTIDLNEVKLTAIEIVAEVYESKPTGEYNAGVSGIYLKEYFKHCSIRNRDEYEQDKKQYSLIYERSYANEEYKNEFKKPVEWNKARVVSEENIVKHKSISQQQSETNNNLEAREGVSNSNNVKEVQSEIETGNSQEPKENSNNEPQTTNEPSNKYGIIEGVANPPAEPFNEENIKVIIEKNIPAVQSENIRTDSKIEDSYTDQDSDKIVEPSPQINYNVIGSEFKCNPEVHNDKELEEQKKPLLEKNVKGIRQLFKPLVVFHKIEIHNNIHFDRTIDLTISSVEGSEPNFYIPQSKLKAKISRLEKQTYHLQKNKPEEEFGEYKLHLTLAKQKEPSSAFSNSFQGTQSSSAAPNEVSKTSGNHSSK